jgi:hypothetical protein
VAARIVLHIGPRKTATTYLQRCLVKLTRRGVIDPSVYPLNSREKDDHNHVPGMIDLLRTYDQIPLQDDAWRHLDGQAASALIDHARQASGPVIFSAEAVAATRLAGARTVIAAFAPAEITVVITARPVGRVLPSSWAQHVRNGNIETLESYLDLRRAERAQMATLETRPDHAFWRSYAYGHLVRRWRSAGARVVVATVPSHPSDPSEMWRRFVAATGLTDVLPADPPRISDAKANASLSLDQSLAIQGFNETARAAGQDRRWTRREHRRMLRHGLRSDPEQALQDGIPEHLHEPVQQWQFDDANDLSVTGVETVGDLADLTATPKPAPSDDEMITALTDTVGRGLLGMQAMHATSDESVDS